MPNPNECLYFLHLPKTAGTSLTEWFSRHFPEKECCPLYRLDKVAELDREELNRYRFFSGHMGWGLLPHLDFRPVIVSWFRDPVERVMSSYWYLRNLSPVVREALGNDTSRQQAEKASTLSLQEWIELPAEEFGIHNHMTWALAGPDADPRFPLNAAIQNLLTLDVIGLVEEMDASLSLVTDRMGWLPSLQGPRRNAAIRQQTSPDKSVTNRIEQLNWMDRALYEVAVGAWREKYLELVMRMGIATPPLPRLHLSPEKTGKSIEIVDDYTLFFAQEWTIMQKNRDGERLKLGFVSPDAPYFHTGWFPPVPCTRVNSRLVRWTSDQLAARIYLPLATSDDLVLQFIVGECVDIGFFESFGVKANDRPLPLEIRPLELAHYPNAHQLSVTIPREILQESPNVTRVRFTNSRLKRVPHAYRLLALDEGIPLGLALLGVHIYPAGSVGCEFTALPDAD